MTKQKPEQRRTSRHLHVAPSAPSDPGDFLSDADVIDMFERGDGRACQIIYRRLVGAVEGALYRILGGSDEAHEDLVQTAFEQIVVTLSNRKFSRACSLSSWASSVTTHVAFNVIRSRTRERRVLDRRRDGDYEAHNRSRGVDLERHIGAREALVFVREHLADMDEGRAKTLVLHDVLGHELSEIAVLTGVSVAAAQSRLVRGRKELWRRLTKDGVVRDTEEA